MTREREVHVLRGWLMLPVTIAVFAVACWLFWTTVRGIVDTNAPPTLTDWYWILAGLVLAGAGVFICFGYFTLQPNESRVLILLRPIAAPFGPVVGTGPIR